MLELASLHGDITLDELLPWTVPLGPTTGVCGRDIAALVGTNDSALAGGCVYLIRALSSD